MYFCPKTDGIKEPCNMHRTPRLLCLEGVVESESQYEYNLLKYSSYYTDLYKKMLKIN